MKKLTMLADANGANLFAMPAPQNTDDVMSRQLAASVAESITVPSGARFVLFSATADFYANYGATATVPADNTTGTASELNPSVRDIRGVTTISVISAGTPIVTAVFYS